MAKRKATWAARRCLHCEVAFMAGDAFSHVVEDDSRGDAAQWWVHYVTCPGCRGVTIELERRGREPLRLLVWPRSARAAQPEVPAHLAADLAEAAAVLPISAKASAALGRRLLQRLLHEKIGAKESLAKEIASLLDQGGLPAGLRETLDLVRHFGNFGVHPIVSARTGEIVEVEPGEAEFVLEVLEGLLDFYYVEPARRAKRLESIRAKITDAGKAVRT